MSKQSNDGQSPTHEEICARAHSIYEMEGRPEGRSNDHWLKAESQLIAERKAQANQQTGKSAAKTNTANQPAKPASATPTETAQTPPRGSKGRSDSNWSSQEPPRRGALQRN